MVFKSELNMFYLIDRKKERMNREEINWVVEINDMRTNEQRIKKGVRYANLERDIKGKFIYPKDRIGKVICNCGEKITERRIKVHLKSTKHNSWIRRYLDEQKYKEFQFTDYICTHGIYEGYKLEDVIYADPSYIDFLIREHQQTFPIEFRDAIEACGLIIE